MTYLYNDRYVFVWLSALVIGKSTICLTTADFIKKGTFNVHSFNDDYLLSRSAQIAKSTFFMKFPVYMHIPIYLPIYICICNGGTR